VARYIGLDVHKGYIRGYEFQPYSLEGKHERHFRFPNTPAGWSQFIAGLDADVQIALEVTGSAFEIHDILAPHAAQVLVSNPVATRRLGSGRHTDREDAVRLAQMLALGTVPAVWVPPHPVRGVRRLLEVRERLGSYRRALTNQARAVLSRHGILLPKGPHALRQVTQAVVDKLPHAEQAILVSVLTAAQTLEEQEKALTASIAARVAHEPAVYLLMTIPGVGMLTAATIWAKLGDPHRFRSPKQVARYVGLDPSVEQSGERDRRGHISRNGDRLLRRMLVEAAWTVARHDRGPLGAFYRRKIKQLGAKRALVALARKLLIVAWRMLCTGEIYRGTQQATVRRKEAELTKLLQQVPCWEEKLLTLLEAMGNGYPGARCKADGTRGQRPPKQLCPATP
jgi:transposase